MSLDGFDRRQIIRGLAAGATATIGTAAVAGSAGAAGQPTGEPIVIGLTISQTAAAGVADHHDYLNGSTLAMEEINAAGGILGRPLKFAITDVDLLNAESCQAAIRNLVDQKVQAISSPFLFVPIPAMDASVQYGCPYVSGNTQRAATNLVAAHPDKYGNVFQMDPSEVYYGLTFPKFLEDLEKSGAWKPRNRKVHIIQEQIAYCQTISKSCQEALKKSSFQLGGITDIQYPVQDWGPVIQDIKRYDAGTVMVDHWVAAEYAAFVKQFRANPLKDTLVYLQYGPSQPEFLQLAGRAAEGFVWSTVLGVYDDAKGKGFREKYKKRFPGKVMGLCYTGGGYDTTYMLKDVWEKTGKPEDFKANCEALRKGAFRGVCGWSIMHDARQEAVQYPVGTDDLEHGMSQLYFQVQGRESKIFYPFPLKQTDYKTVPWA